MAKKQNKVDFERFCRDHNIEYKLPGSHHHTSHGWIQIHCPFCSGGNYGFHMGFNPDGGTFNCWRCGSHKSWDVYKKLLGVKSDSQVGRVLRNYESGVFEDGPPDDAPKSRKKHCPEPPDMGPMKEQHRKYLARRGFDPDELESKWGLKGTGPLGLKWKWRVIAPVHDIDGDVCAYNGRALRDDVKPKYKFSSNKDITIDPRKIIYGIHKPSPQQGVVIVEGMTDVWRLGEGAVAVMGIDWKEEQADILRKFNRRFVLFDPDKDAQRQAMKLAKWLSAFRGETEIIKGIDKDPGDMEPDEAKNIMEELGF